jgi:hypothetical protein
MAAEGTISISTWALATGAMGVTAVHRLAASTTVMNVRINPRINPTSRRFGLSPRKVYNHITVGQDAGNG